MARGPEAKIQDTTVKWARQTYPGKLIARKFQAGRYGTNGWPDYDFLILKKITFFIEFKAPGADCTPLQLERHKELRALGFNVYVIDNVLAGKEVIRREFEYASGKARKRSPVMYGAVAT
jgi:hypothetical protein